jgi:single-stranded-DNA-specific exonuclease
MRFHWQFAVAQPLLAQQLARQHQVSPLLAQCLLNRNLSQPDAISAFLEPRLRQLSDPFRLPNMAAAVDRLWRARQGREPIVVFGDYDVDGVTATALLLEVLGGLGWNVTFYLPHRMDEGYGLSQEAAENCLRKHPVSLLLAVDCGSTTVTSINWLQQRGVDVIVLDHHQVSTPAPPAAALVNPRSLAARPDGLADSADPADSEGCELCSVGLAFKLAHALLKRGREQGLPEAEAFDLRNLLDLVTLGTIADLVPLTGENRILVSAGLPRLTATQRPGLIALKQVAHSPASLSVHDVGFQLGPRLNAAGRLETAEAALQLLRASDPDQALALAQSLDGCNRERQAIERTIGDEVIGLLRTKFNPDTDWVIVEGQPGWHIGVVGIVASRVVQQFYRPTVIVGAEADDWRGSGRSIPGFDLAKALSECGDLLVRHGGHAMAAGLTIKPHNVDPLRARLNLLARQTLRPADLQPPLRLDAQVALSELTFESLAMLGRLNPIGQGIPPVQLCARQLIQQRPLQRIGAEKKHVKMWVTDGLATHEAIWWGGGNQSLPVGRFDLAFVPQIHEYNGHARVQLKVLDWQPSETTTTQLPL